MAYDNIFCKMRHRFLTMLEDFGHQGISINKLRILYSSSLKHRHRFMELYGYVTVDSLIKALEHDGLIEVCPNAFGGSELVKLKSRYIIFRMTYINNSEFRKKCAGSDNHNNLLPFHSGSSMLNLCIE